MRSELYEWRPVVGYEGLYEVNNLGEVRSLDRVVYQGNHPQRRKSIIKKQTPHKDGHLMVMLSKEGQNKNCQVHRLVAETFIPNPYNLPVINHKDEDPTNNRADNLEWCTIAYNNNYGTVKERLSKSKRNSTYNTKTVQQYTIDGNFIQEWPSTMEVERVLGYAHTHIADCCRHKLHCNTAYGYKWEYAN